MNAYCSYSTPEYHAINNSVEYARATIDPVATRILFIFSTWSTVIKFSRCMAFLVIINRVSTIAKPEKIAHATKYGGKIVVCHPGIIETAKSKLTIVWTESTSGVANPANIR
jgi:hypothetical protein